MFRYLGNPFSVRWHIRLIGHLLIWIGAGVSLLSTLGSTHRAGTDGLVILLAGVAVACAVAWREGRRHG